LTLSIVSKVIVNFISIIQTNLRRILSFLAFIFLLSIAGGIISSFRANRPLDPDDTAQKISSRIADIISRLDEESITVIKQFSDTQNISYSEFHFLIIQGEEIVTWNDDHFIPPVRALLGDFAIKFLKAPSGEFLIRKWKMDADHSLIALIPLHIQYKISNSYLPPVWNEAIFEYPPATILEPESDQGFPVVEHGVVVFKFLPTSFLNQKNTFWDYVTVLFFSIAMVVGFLALYWVVQAPSKRYPDLIFLGLVFIVYIIRKGMIYFDFPSRFIDSALFDPKFFASSDFNPSLGDLALNSIAVSILCFYLFRTYYRFKLFKSIPSRFNWIVSIFSVLAILFATLFGYVFIQTIYNNSSITLSISESLGTDGLRIVTFFALMLCWLSCFLFMHVFVRILLQDQNRMRVGISILIGVTLFVVINVFSGQYFISSLLVGLAYLGCVIAFKLYHGLQSLQYITFAYFFVAVLTLSLNGVVAVNRFEQVRKVSGQFRFANNFLSERDHFAEYLLQESATRIENDVFIQARMATPMLGMEIIRQKINQFFLSGYFNRYNLSIKLFSSQGESLDDSASATFSDFLSLYDREAYHTDYKNIYFVSTAEGDFARKYVALIPISKVESRIGYIVIELSLKRVIPESVYPELLVDSRFQRNDHSEEFSYAILDGDSIQYSSGDFNYNSFVKHYLSQRELYTKGLEDGGYLHIASKDSNSRVSIVSSPAGDLTDWLSNFSLLVVLGMSIVLLFLVVQGIIDFSRSGKLYLAARIQLILNLAIFLPLVVVSSIILTLTTRSSLQQLNDEFLTKAKKFGITVAGIMQSGNNPSADFEAEFTHLASLANLDANVYSSGGKMLSTSQPLIFENHLLAPYINPAVLARIKQGDKSFVSTEEVGSLRFYVAYSALLSPETGAQIGILGIPFFQSAASLEKLQIKVLSTILSIFTLLFIVLLLISFVVTNWLTAPLNLITRTLGRISLTRENAPLEWKSDDEIGLMIKEYNQMLKKLQESRLQIERNQRELAWREIAQQVAHEIKNPLTPMKLTLQQLERTLENETLSPEKINKSVAALLSQVNSLNDIASSFSSFAKMPEPIIEKINLYALLLKVVNLHGQEGEMLLETTIAQATVLADEKLLSRIFSNIILNGLQAHKPNSTPTVTIRMSVAGDYYRISFTDNGRGIDKSWEEKVFIPHFTTKQSGSGLGLAIAKQGIEQLGGKIWFDTSSEGTTFFIELKQVKE